MKFNKEKGHMVMGKAMPKEEKKEEELLRYYEEGAAIEARLNFYREKKEDVIKNLQFLNYLISDIEGKQEEVNRCIYGDLRLKVTSIKSPLSLKECLVINEANIKLIHSHIRWYNIAIKEEKFVDAGVSLSDLKEIATKLREEIATTISTDSKTIEKEAHTPVVIKAKKRK